MSGKNKPKWCIRCRRLFKNVAGRGRVCPECRTKACRNNLLKRRGDGK